MSSDVVLHELIGTAFYHCSDACLCISGIPSFIATNPIAHTASLIVGTGTITTALTNMVNIALWPEAPHREIAEPRP